MTTFFRSIALWFAVFGVCRSAFADMAPIPPTGKKFVGTSVELVGLDSDAFVLIAWDKPYEGKISSYLSFSPDRPRLQVGHGRQRHNMYAPNFHLMPKAAFEAWSVSTQAIIGKQMEDCQEGRGCSHISRFTPRYPPPEDAVDCNLSFNATLSAPLDGPDSILARVKVVELGPKVCRLELLTDGREGLNEVAQNVPKTDATIPTKVADAGGTTPPKETDAASLTPREDTEDGAPSSGSTADVGTHHESPKAPISSLAAKKGCESGGASFLGLVLIAAWFSRRRR